MKKTIFSVMAALSIASASYPAATAKISGEVTLVTTTYGSSGSINRIDIQVYDSEHSNSTWVLTCRRANSTIGWCAGVVQGNRVVAEGYFITSPTNQVEVTLLGIKP